MKKKISNVSSTLIINTYEGFYYDNAKNLENIQKHIKTKYDNKKLIKIAHEISKTINTEILNESSHNFEPFGDSSALLIQANLKLYNSGSLHLKESHITFHTYIEDILNNFIIIRLEFHICSCSDANVFHSVENIIQLNKELNLFTPDVFTLDYLRRGSKYGKSHMDIINDNCRFNNEIFLNLYNVTNCTAEKSIFGTQNYFSILKDEIMHDKFSGLSTDITSNQIYIYRDFLFRSYGDYQLSSDASNLDCIEEVKHNK